MAMSQNWTVWKCIFPSASFCFWGRHNQQMRNILKHLMCCGGEYVSMLSVQFAPTLDKLCWGLY